MKSAPFTYRAASSVAEATAALAEAGSAGAVLAGGQSLMIDLHYRRKRPEVVIDINRVSGLGDLRTAAGWAEIGATVRHRELERAGLGDPLGTLLRLAASHIAHPPVRNRGTFAGSLAWAHPAAEWCALASALRAEIVLVSSRGIRTVQADEWFTGRHETSRRPDELITMVRLPLLGAGTGVGFAEHRRTHASFALVAAVTAITVSEGRVRRASIGLAGAADTPLRAWAAESVLSGRVVSEDAIDAAAEAAAAAVQEVSEPGSSLAYRRQALLVMVRRSLRQAMFGLARAPGSARSFDDGKDEGWVYR